MAALAKATTATERLALDLAVLRQACTDMTVLLTSHQQSGLHGLNVNLTPSSLVHPGLDVAVLDILEETGLPPVYLRLEVPETAAFADLAEATDVLRRITSAGVALTLDDVGVEAVGLRYLKTLAIDGIKIDRSFITRMLNGASDLAVVRLLVDLCAGLEIRLTAEGVERCEQLEVARGLGVRAIQGYHVARPMPFDAARPVPRPRRCARLRRLLRAGPPRVRRTRDARGRPGRVLGVLRDRRPRRPLRPRKPPGPRAGAVAAVSERRCPRSSPSRSR